MALIFPLPRSFPFEPFHSAGTVSENLDYSRNERDEKTNITGRAVTA